MEWTLRTTTAAEFGEDEYATVRDVLRRIVGLLDDMNTEREAAPP
jgi:hypothetical protein